RLDALLDLRAGGVPHVLHFLVEELRIDEDALGRARLAVDDLLLEDLDPVGPGRTRQHGPAGQRGNDPNPTTSPRETEHGALHWARMCSLRAKAPWPHRLQTRRREPTCACSRVSAKFALLE